MPALRQRDELASRARLSLHPLGAPLLLCAALLASRPATARQAGVLAGIAVFAKLPFALPAV